MQDNMLEKLKKKSRKSLWHEPGINIDVYEV